MRVRTIRARAAVLVLAIAALLLGGCERSRPAAVAGSDETEQIPATEQAPAVSTDEREAIEWAGPGRHVTRGVSGGLAVQRLVPLRSPVAAGPVVGDGAIFYASVWSELVRLDLESEQETWTRHFTDRIVGLGTSPDGLVVTTVDRILALDAETAETLWEARVEVGSVSTSVVSSGAGLYFGTSEPALVALTSDGEERWKVSLRAPAVDRLELFDGGVHGVTSRGTAFRVDAASGDLLWQRETVVAPLFAPAVNRSDGSLALVTSDGVITLLDALGAITAQFEVDAEAVLAPVVWAGDTVLVPEAEGSLAAYDRRGEPLWRRFVGAHLAGSPARYEGVVVVSGALGGLSSIDLASGDTLSRASLPAAASGDSLALDETLFMPLRNDMIAIVSTDGNTDRPPLLDDTRSHVLPESGRFRLQADRVRLSLGTSTDSVFEISVAAVPSEDLVLSIETDDGEIISTNMGKVALTRTIRAPLAAGRSYELVILRPDPRGEVVISIQTDQLQ